MKIGEACVKCTTNCVDCEAGKLLKEHSCVDSCEDFYYVKEKTCAKCNPTCKTCTGPAVNECLSCKGSLL